MKEYISRIVNSDFTPFYVLGLLLIFPYIIFEATPLFPVRRSLGVMAHLALSIALTLILFFAFLLGTRAAGKPIMRWSTSNSEPYSSVGDVAHGWLWSLVLVSLIAHLVLIIVGGAAYSSGSFVGAREDFLFKGVGVFLRLYMIALPMLWVSGRRRNSVITVSKIFFVLVLLRALLLSERVALLEFFVVLWVAVRFSGGVIRPWTLGSAIIIMGLLYAIGGWIRLAFQKEYDNHLVELGTGGAFNSLMVYYADPQNKFYRALFDGLRYPGHFYLAFFDEVFGRTYANISAGGAEYDALAASDADYIKVLNNPGGLAQDVSDFGGPVGLLSTFIKFALAGYVTRRGHSGPISLSLSAFFVMGIIEFPRFNYLYLPFVVVLLIIAAATGLLVLFSSGVRRRATA